MTDEDHSTAAQPAWLDWFYIPFSLVFVGLGLALTFFSIYADPGHPRFLLMGDAWVENGPKLYYGDAALEMDEWALWNPLTFCGHPAAANPQYMVFYPPNVLRSLLTPGTPTPFKTHAGINLMIGAHMLLGGFAAYLFARAHRFTGAAATVTAFAFVFSAPMVSRAIGHWQFVVMVAWLPLALLLLHAVMTARSHRSALRAALALGIVFGVTILGGSPHFMLLTGLTLGFYWLFFRITSLWPDSGEPARPAANFGRRVGRDVVQGTVALALAVAVASPMLLPAMEYSGYSARADTGGPNEVEIIDVGESDWNLFQRFVVYTGTKNYEGIRAAGAGVTLLALLGLVYGHRKTVFVFGGLLLVLIDCSVTEPLVFGKLVTWLSPYKMSSPGRAMLVACVPLGMIAGAGVDGLLNAHPDRRGKIVRTILILAAAGLVLGTLWPLVHPHPFLDVSIMSVVLPAAVALVLAAGTWFREPITFGAVIAMLLLGESLVWNSKYIPHATREGLTYDGSMAELHEPQQFWQGNRRSAHPIPNVNLFALEPAINGHDPLHIAAVRNVLCREFEGDDYRRNITPLEVSGFHYRGNTFLKRAFWLNRQYVAGPLADRDTLFPPATTVYLESPPGDLQVPDVSADTVEGSSVSPNHTEHTLVRTEDAPVTVRSDATTVSGKGVFYKSDQQLPRNHGALYVGVTPTVAAQIVPVFKDAGANREYYGRLTNVPAAPGRVIHFEVPMPDVTRLDMGLVPEFENRQGQVTVNRLALRIDRNDEHAHIGAIRRTPNTATVDLHDLPGHRILTFIDSAYPGWRAFIDGEPVRLMDANDVFKAVEVPPGSHTVRFEFRPVLVGLGLGLAKGAAAAAIGAGLLTLLPAPWVRSRKPTPDVDDP